MRPFARPVFALVLLLLASLSFAQSLKKQVLFISNKTLDADAFMHDADFFSHDSGMVARSGADFYFYDDSLRLQKQVSMTLNAKVTAVEKRNTYLKMVATPSTAYYVRITKTSRGAINTVKVCAVNKDGYEKDITIVPGKKMGHTEAIYATDKGLHCLLFNLESPTMSYELLCVKPDGSYSWLPTDALPTLIEKKRLKRRGYAPQDQSQVQLKTLFYNKTTHSMVYYTTYADDSHNNVLEQYINDAANLKLRTVEIGLETGIVVENKEWSLGKAVPSLHGFFLPTVAYDPFSGSLLLMGLFNYKVDKLPYTTIINSAANGHYLIAFNYQTQALVTAKMETFKNLNTTLGIKLEPSISSSVISASDAGWYVHYEPTFLGVDKHTKEVVFNYTIGLVSFLEVKRELRYSIQGELKCIKEKRLSPYFGLPKNITYPYGKPDGHFVYKEDKLADLYKDKKVEYTVADQIPLTNPVFIIFDKESQTVIGYR